MARAARLRLVLLLALGQQVPHRSPPVRVSAQLLALMAHQAKPLFQAAAVSRSPLAFQAWRLAP